MSKQGTVNNKVTLESRVVETLFYFQLFILLYLYKVRWILILDHVLVTDSSAHPEVGLVSLALPLWTAYTLVQGNQINNYGYMGHNDIRTIMCLSQGTLPLA